MQSIHLSVFLFVCLLAPQVCLGNYLKCAKSMIELQDSYNKLDQYIYRKLFNETLEEIPIFIENAESVLTECNQAQYVQVIEKVLPLQCVKTLPSTIELAKNFVDQSVKESIASLPLFIKRFAQSQRYCPLLDRIVSELIPDKNFNLVQCVDQSEILELGLVKLVNDYQANRNFSIINDDVFQIAEDIDTILYGCNLQKFQYEYEQNFPKKCRVNLRDFVNLILQIKNNGKHWKDDTKLVFKLNFVLLSIAGNCPFVEKIPVEDSTSLKQQLTHQSE